MPKEVDESKLNYNRFPGEQVTATEDIVKVGGKTFHLVYNYREGFDAEKLEQRFSDIFDKYDYIVGDWGFEQLRLKGFFSVSRKKMQSENKIDRLPFQSTLPESCIKKSNINLNVVVFPDPFCPIKPKISPSSIVKLRSSTATSSPNVFRRFFTSSIPSSLKVK